MSIAGYDAVRPGLDGAFEDSVILRIVEDGVYTLFGLDEIGQILDLRY